MNMQRELGPRCPSGFALDRLLAGESSADDVGIERHVAGCERCSARVAELRRAQARFAVLPDALVRHVREQTARRAWRWPLPLAAAGVLLAFWATWTQLGPGGESVGVRTKGGTHVTFYVMHDGAVRPGLDGERVHPGDSLQFVYASDRDMYFAIVSIDGNRKASAYFDQDGRAAPIARSRRGVLDRSTVLDATLGNETLYALFCAGPIALDAVLAELERAPEQRPSAAGCSIERHTVVKVAR
jgi:hypothetical protein